MKLFVLTLFLLSISVLQAQTSKIYFVAYKEKIPGSEFSFKMVPVPGGTFTMGGSEKETGRKADEGPQKKVMIEPFWMGAMEVSRDDFDVFYKDENTSQNSKVDAITRPSPQYIDMSLGMGKEGGYPVNSLSQHAALMYCRWLYDKTGVFYRLPTEAEWEYACRAGSNTSFYFGNDTSQLGNYAWYAGNSDNKFHKSGEKLPNAWGLYDMLGNVSEWTLDHYDERAMDKVAANSLNIIPKAIPAHYPKVTRGGTYEDGAEALRCANRQPSDPSWNRRDPQIPKSKWWLTEAAFIGFRIVRPQQQPTAEQVQEFFKEYLGN